MGENTQNTELLSRRQLQDGEFSRVERLFRENKYFSFTSGEKIETAADIAYIFKQLETASVENSFAVFMKNGEPIVLHMGIGTFDQVLVNNRAFKLAFDRIQPDKTYFIHNHPSGNIKPSVLDRKAVAQLEEIIGTGITNIIINTTSGKYSIFNKDFTLEEETKERNTDDKEVCVYSFDTQVFSEDYDPSADRVLDSKAIAAFISSHRLGQRDKINALILNKNLGIVGNILLNKNKIEAKDVKELSKKIFDDTITFGGFCVALYGTGLNKSQKNAINELATELKKVELRLVDAVSIFKSSGYYLSFSDAGLLEDEPIEYITKSALADEGADSLYKLRSRSIRSTKEARAFLDSLGYNAGLSSLITGRNGEKYLKYKANGVVTPNIVLGETTPYDVMYQFLLYGNVYDLDIPQVVNEQFEAERQGQREIHKKIESDTIELIKKRLHAERIAFADVIDSERGYRIAFTHAKTDNGNYINYFDVADLEALDEYLDYIRKKSEDARKLFTKANAGNMQMELDFDNVFEQELPIKSNIQGLERYSEEEIKELVKDHIDNLIELEDFSIGNMAIYGSRGRGDGKSSSDLDVVVEYSGEYKEDGIFNILNEESMEIDGIKVDINPIRKEQTGTLDSFIARSAIYDEIKKIENKAKDKMSNADTTVTFKAYQTGDITGKSLAKELFEKYRRHYIENNLSKGVDLGHMAALVLGSNIGVLERAKVRYEENGEGKWLVEQIEEENNIDSKVFAEYGVTPLEDRNKIYPGDHIYIPNDSVGTVGIVDSIEADNSVIYRPYEYGEPSADAKRLTHTNLLDSSKVLVYRNTNQNKETISAQATISEEVAPVNTGSVEKIEDWGEKIAGARKDIMKEISASVDIITEEALQDNPISKIWKRPDYAKMYEQGEITAEDALVMESITRAILSVPKPRITTRASLQRRKLTEWTKGVVLLFELLKQYSEASEHGKELVVNHLRDDYRRASVIYHVLKELGYPSARIERFPIPDITARINSSKEVNYYGPNLLRVSKEEAKADALRYVKTALGYDDLTYKFKDFYKHTEYKTTQFETGKYTVSTSVPSFRVLQSTFDSEAKAMEYAAKQEELGRVTHIAPEKKWKHDITGYTLRVRDSYKRDTHPVIDKVFATESEVSEYIENNLPELEEKANEIISSVYSKENKTTAADRLNLFIEIDREGDKPGFSVFLGLDKMTGRGNLVKLAFFEDWKEAKKWSDEHREAIATRLTELNKQHRNGMEFRPAQPRVGEDYRRGRDVTVEELGTTFGFRGIQFGNWTNQEDRQRAINETYDSLMDMSKALGVSPKSLSLGGELAMAFGARGVGGFSAHYEPSERVINLTKTQGAGSLAHEWWHAVDNYFGRQGWNQDSAMATDTWRNGENQLREEVRQAIGEFVENIHNSEYFKRCQFSDYWGSTAELTARYFAEYIKHKIEAKGEHNDFLSHTITSEKDYKNKMYAFYKTVTTPEKQMSFEEFEKHPKALYRYAYPTEAEMEQINPSLDKFFGTLNEKIEKDKTILYDLREEEKITPERKRLGEIAVAMLRKAGLNVVLDREQMRQVLEASSLDIQKMAIDEVNERFDKQLDSYADGSMKTNEQFSLGKPGLILLAAGIPAKDIRMNQSVLRHHLPKHSLVISDIKGLAKAIQNPIMVYEWGSKAKSHIIITELTTSDNRKISVAIKVEDDGSVQEINEVTSVHGKDVEYFLSGMLNAKAGGFAEALRYVEKEKALGWLAQSSPKEDSTTDQRPISVANIIKNFENPKISDEILQKMTVFHGSPYSFDAFDHTNMGKGEGAQSHGWGTYVTKSADTGRKYAHNLAFDSNFKYKSTLWYALDDADEDRAGVILRYMRQGSSFEEAKHSFVEHCINIIDAGISPDLNKERLDKVSLMTADDFEVGRNLYEVNIPDDNGKNYLDEDKIVTANVMQRVLAQCEKEGLDASVIHKGKENTEKYGSGRIKNKSGDYRFRGRDLYDYIKQLFPSPEGEERFYTDNRKEASAFLARCGFVGIKYNGSQDGECYVIFDEKDARIVNHSQYMNTPNGEVYGFVKNDTIYLDPEVLNANTAIHEYTHLWTRALMQNNLVLWEHGKKLLQDTPLWETIKNDGNYSDIAHDDNLIASEVLARLSGHDGEYLLNDMATYFKVKGIMSEIETDNFINRLKQLVELAWRYIKDIFMPWTEKDVSRISLIDFVEMPIKDLLTGVNPLQQKPEEVILRDIEYSEAISSGNTKRAMQLLREEAERKGSLADNENNINITYDDRGNLIPLSDRFNETDGRVQYHISAKARAQYERLLDRKQPDMPKHLRKQALDYLESLENNKENNKKIKIAITWLANGRIRLPEDITKVDDAISVADKAKVDPMSYAGPMELLNAHKEYKPTRQPLDPDNMPGLYNKVELPYGVTVYDVADSVTARESMRQIINTHFGEDCNPWCVLQGDKNGWLTDESREYWDSYDSVQRKVAFQNGHLIAFRASDTDPNESNIRQKIVDELSKEYDIKLLFSNFNNSITWDIPMFGEEDIPAMANILGIYDRDFDFDEYSNNPDYTFDFDGLKREVEMAFEEIMEQRFSEIPQDEALEYLSVETWWDRQDESSVGIPIKIKSEEIENAVGYGELYLNGRIEKPTWLERGNRHDGKYEGYRLDGDKYYLAKESHWKDGKLDGLEVGYDAKGKTTSYYNYVAGKPVGFCFDKTIPVSPSLYLFDIEGKLLWEESYNKDFSRMTSKFVSLPDIKGEYKVNFNRDTTISNRSFSIPYSFFPSHREEVFNSNVSSGDLSTKYVSKIYSYDNGYRTLELYFFESGQVSAKNELTDGIITSQSKWYQNGQQMFSLKVTKQDDNHSRLEVYKWNETGEVQYHIDIIRIPALIAQLRGQALVGFDKNTTKIQTVEFGNDYRGESAPPINPHTWGQISRYRDLIIYKPKGLDYLSKIKEIKLHKAMEDNILQRDQNVSVTQELIARLRDMGIEVNLYANGSAEHRLATAQQSHNFSDNEQRVYGYTDGGKIYLNQDALNPETPIHEYTHLWSQALRMKQPEAWSQVVEMMKTEQRLWSRIQEGYPQLTTDDEVAEEVLAHYSGKRGAERFIREYGSEVTTGIIDKILEAIEKFWNAIREMFMSPWEKDRHNNIFAVPDKFLSDKRALADSILVDFLMGNNPTELTKEKLYEQASNDRVNNVPRIVYEALEDLLGKESADNLSVALPYLEYTQRDMNVGIPYEEKETPWSFRVQDYTTDYARQAVIIDALHPSDDLQQLAEDSNKYAILDYLSRGGSLYNMAGEEYLWNIPEELGKKFVEAEHILLEIQDFPIAFEERKEAIERFNELWMDYEESLYDYLGIGNIYEVDERKETYKASFKELDRRFRETVSEYNAVMAELPDSAYNRYASSEVHFHKQNVREDNIKEVDWVGKLNVYSSSTYLPVRNLSHKVKEGNSEAIDKAADIMSVIVKRIPDYENAVLVPIPNRSGKAEYTKELASKIADTIGIDYYDLLVGQPHASLHQEKADNGMDGLRLMQFDVKKGNSLPDRKVILIDNVMDTGTTAMSALRTFGRDCSLVVLGSTTNHRRYNYPVNIKIMPVLNINFTKEESDQQKEALVNSFERLARLMSKDIDVSKMFKKDRFQNWDDVLKAAEKGVEHIIYDNKAETDDKEDILTSARKHTERIFKEDAAIRLNKDVLAVLDKKDISFPNLKRPNGNTVSIRLNEKLGISYTDRSWYQSFEGMQTLSNRDYDSLVGQIVNEVNKRLLSSNFAETDGRDIVGRISFSSPLTTLDGKQQTVNCYKLTANETGSLAINVASKYSDFAANNDNVINIDNFVANDQAQILAEILKAQHLTALQTIFADNYTVGDKIKLIQDDVQASEKNNVTQTLYINNKNQSFMNENDEKKLVNQPVEQQVAQAEEQPKPQQEEKPKKSRWDGLDYTKYKFPDGVKVEKPNVFRSDTSEGTRYKVTAIINGERRTSKLYYNDVNAFFEKDESGALTRRVTAEILAAKYFAKEYMPKEEVSETVAEQEPAEKQPVEQQAAQAEEQSKPQQGEFGQTMKLFGEYYIPVYALSYFTNGTDAFDGMEEEDEQAILDFEKTLPTPYTINIPDDIDSAKTFVNNPAFGLAADCVKVQIYLIEEKIEEKVRDDKHEEHHTEQDAEHARQEAAERDASVKAQAEKKEAARKEEEMKEQEAEEQKPMPKAQAVLLAAALSSALSKDGLWLNGFGKKQPQIHGSNTVISPFNALAMALNSDQKGYKTNVYTHFNTAKTEGFSVRSKQEAFPFNWYDWDKYTNKYNSSDVIDKATYEALPVEEKELYKTSQTLTVQKIFNIDQTLMKQSKGDLYKSYLEQQTSVVTDSRDKQIKVEQSKVKKYLDMQKKYSDSIILLRDGDFYQAYGANAKKLGDILNLLVTEMSSVKDDNGQRMKLVGFPAHQLDQYLPKIVRSGNRVAIADMLENQNLKQLGEESTIYAKMEEMSKALLAVDASISQSNLSETRFDSGKLTITLNRKAEPGQEITTAIGRLNDLYRAVVGWTGTEERLGRQTRQNMLPEDAVKYDRLIQELASGALMLRQGLPARISPENIVLSDYWQRELCEDPSILTRIERDVNNAVKVVSDIQNGKAQDIDYSKMRGDKAKTVNQSDYTITSELSSQVSLEDKTIALVKHPENKTVDVILPQGASLKMGEDISGMNKNRIISALIKEGYLGENIKFYNAGGAFGLAKPNDYYKDKEVEIARLKQFQLVTVSKIDVPATLVKLNDIQFQNIQMIRDDNNRWALFVAPVKGQGEAFAVYPEEKDTKRFFEAVKAQGSMNDVVKEIGTKYYNLVNNHPNLKADFLMPKIEDADILNRITRVNITQDKKNESSIVMWAEIDGKVQAPRELTKTQYQRFFLVPDQEAYKFGLAAEMFKDILVLQVEKQAAQQQIEQTQEQELEPAEYSEEQVEEQEEQRTRGRGL